MLEVAAKLYIGDVVEMRKVHPCGGYVWEIVRVGADIGLVCRTCGRRVLLPRRDFARGVKRFVQRGAPAESLAESLRESPAVPPSGTPAWETPAGEPAAPKRKKKDKQTNSGQTGDE
jgi:hypothetical protein